MSQGHDHVPTEETRLLVKELYAAGITKERIAKRFEICDDTLNKHYKNELDNEKEGMIAKLGKSLYQKALDGDGKAAEFWLKCQGKWSYAKAQEDTDRAAAAEAVMSRIIDKLQD
jgi:plasmid maintenance system antidote protein VapI